MEKERIVDYKTQYARRARQLIVMYILVAVFVAALTVSSHAALQVRDLAKSEKAVAMTIMKKVKAGKGRIYRFKTSLSKESMVRVEKAINNTYYSCDGRITIDTGNYDKGEPVPYEVDIKQSKRDYELNWQLRAAVRWILKKARLRKSMKPKQKYDAIAKAVAARFRGVDSAGYESPKAASYLKRRIGNCSVYFRVFAEACRKTGLNCQMVRGILKEGGRRYPHGWNRVKIGRRWYYYDVTWYDGTGNSKYLGSKKQWKTHKGREYETLSDPGSKLEALFAY